MKKRVLSALLAAVMACTLLCIPAGAAAQEYQAGYMFVTFPNDVKKQETPAQPSCQPQRMGPSHRVRIFGSCTPRRRCRMAHLNVPRKGHIPQVGPARSSWKQRSKPAGIGMLPCGNPQVPILPWTARVEPT